MGPSHTKSQSLFTAEVLLSALQSSSYRGLEKFLDLVFAIAGTQVQLHSPCTSKVFRQSSSVSKPSSSQKCLLKKKSESGNSCAKRPSAVSPGGHTWPSVSPLMANLSGSQRSNPLTQTAGKMMETIFFKKKKNLLFCSVYVSGSRGTFERRPFASRPSPKAWVLGA